MEIKNNILIQLIIILLLINSVHLYIDFSPINITLNLVIRRSLPDKSYDYFKLDLPKFDIENSHFLLIEAKRNEDQDFIDNVYSDPNVYISQVEQMPSEEKNTWNSGLFGDEIISINQKYVNSFSVFYISVFCENKCNYILNARLYNNYEMKEDKIYTINMTPNDVQKFTFKSKKDFEFLKISCISDKMKPFRIFMSKNDPSSSNTFTSYPIFTNGYYFLIKKGDSNYGTDQEYEVLIENKEFKQDLSFWINYDNEDIEINELSPLYGNAFQNSGNCYFFNISQQYIGKNIIISTILFNGNGNIKIGGWEKVKEMKIINGDRDTYPIISGKSILLTEENFKNYGNYTNEQSKKLHFCFIGNEETSYSIKIYYQKNIKLAQELNYLLPGISTSDILPGKTLTKYKLNYFEINKDIKIELKTKNGNPKLYLYYSYDDNYIDIDQFNIMMNTSRIIEASELFYKDYGLEIEESENKCMLQKYSKDEIECKINAIVYCTSEIDCLYELIFDHIGNVIIMKPKISYSNVLTHKEIDKYEIHINDEKIKNFAVVLTQNTGNVKLKLAKYISEKGDIIIENSEKFNKNYMPNVLEIRARDFMDKNIKGIFSIEVIGYSFSTYSIYYYTFDDDKSSKLDHKNIRMELNKGNVIQDYMTENQNIKVYSYENTNINNQKSDLFIYLDAPYSTDYRIYIFKDLNDYIYEKGKVKGFIWQIKSFDYFIHIEKTDPNYITGILYIMVFANRNSEHNQKITNKKENYAESQFLLAITDENTPLTLLEGVEFRQALTSKKLYQTYFYSHQNKDEDFILSISIVYKKIKISLKIGEKYYINEKKISKYFSLRIESEELKKYCPNTKYCNMEIKIEYPKKYDMDLEFTLLCKGSKNSIVHLKKNSIEKRIISNNENQYFLLELEPMKDTDIKIISAFNYGKGILYAKKVDKNTVIQPTIFPYEGNYHYKSSRNRNNEEISILTIPYEDIKNDYIVKILITVRGIFSHLGKTQGEYSLSVSNIIDDIFPNKNYHLLVLKGEIKYYHFILKDNKPKLSISLTNTEFETYMDLNYGKINKDINQFYWHSHGNYNKYIDITADDPFFISRKMNNLDGEYYLAVQSFQDTYFNLFISYSDINIMTITEEFPGTCSCETEGDFCYFRYENINSMENMEITDQEMIFYFEFTFGSAEIYANLFPNGNNGEIIESLKNNLKSDFKSSYTNDYLRIKLTSKEKKYTLDSVLILSTKCKTKSMFDFNVRKLIKSSDILNDSDGISYLSMDKDNVIYISQNLEKPVKLALYSTNYIPISYEVKALSGLAFIHCYIDNEGKEDKEMIYYRVKGYKHISEFSVEEKDSKSYFDILSRENSYRQNVYFEINAKKNCLFSIYLHYSFEPTLIPMSKEIQGKFSNGKFYAYLELHEEYEEIIFTIDKMYSKSKYSIYAKTSIIEILDFKQILEYKSPSANNYDIKATSNEFNPTLSVKIKNLPKEEYYLGFKIIVIFLIESNNKDNNNDKFTMIAYPNIDHCEIIYPQPYKYTYSSISNKDKDKTVFTFKKKESENNLLIMEISSCKGDFGYKLTNSLKNNAHELESYMIKGKGKKIIYAEIEDNIEYYLSIYGIKEDDLFFDYMNNKNTDIDFLLYYYTINKNDFFKDNFDYKFTYEVTNPGNIVLNLPNFEIMSNNKNQKIKKDDLSMSVIISENSTEFEYMDSICYLSKKNEIIESKNLYKDYKIKINKKKNIIEIKNLDRTKFYYINVLITNKKTGQFLALDAIQIKADYKKEKSVVITVLLIGIIVLMFVSFYFYRKFKITKEIIDYETNDTKKLGSIPKSINELKNITDAKKNKYDSLTEDSNLI